MDARAKMYDSVAEEYERRIEKLEHLKKETTQILLSFLKPGQKVLDIGCGVGYDTLMLARKCHTVGIDISPEMVKRAKCRNRLNKKTKIILGDFISWPFKGKYNAIFANAFIHLFPKTEYEIILSKIYKLLYSGGFAYISTTKSNRSKEGWYRKDGYESTEKRFRKFWTKSEFQNALKNAGFVTVYYFENVDPFGKTFMYFIIRR